MLAAASCAPCGFCIGAQISTRSARTSAVQFIGSIGAWAMKGTLYSASSRVAAAAAAAVKSPSARTTWPSWLL